MIALFGMLAGVLSPYFEKPLGAAALRHHNLVAYVVRVMQRFYPEFERKAA
jgi:hypothetical protein